MLASLAVQLPYAQPAALSCCLVGRSWDHLQPQLPGCFKQLQLKSQVGTRDPVSVLLVPAAHFAGHETRRNAATVWPEPSSLRWQLQGWVRGAAWGLGDVEVNAGQDGMKYSPWSSFRACAPILGQVVG